MEIISAIVTLIILVIVIMGINTISDNTRKALRVLNEIAKSQGVDEERILQINDPDRAYKQKLKRQQLEKGKK